MFSIECKFYKNKDLNWVQLRRSGVFYRQWLLRCAADIDQLITIRGMVIRTSSLVPEMREAFFECNVCRQTLTVEIERGRIAEPTLCAHCSTNHSYHLVHNRSQFSDKQMVKLQETPGRWRHRWRRWRSRRRSARPVRVANFCK